MKNRQSDSARPVFVPVEKLGCFSKPGRIISSETRARLIKKLEAYNVNIITNHNVSKILTETIIIQDKISGEQTIIETDQVVMAMGVQPFNPLEATLIDHV
ncbi:hypothetical protein RRV45_02805 [Bacillus sp. DTU_2020_1000418_1_SI_GHA_SEK_038]|uniref:hypothetical protein n=1 Tax=Bacillus sp. DTU_2020_1000418_1_SI_GHA_SEK_038 TaxID=3077585 RepID=UPI0028E3716E|nr:hypothetical protein [Bacillus sp. DTU_2020_1000418_1_SI_GHA_SEK_038]WNS75966.1 hypothetical protein RRV45_02805 [Bacillus sp. DTU_2020_1000418_1_SI_GHA_SEK_038]